MKRRSKFVSAFIVVAAAINITCAPSAPPPTVKREPTAQRAEPHGGHVEVHGGEDHAPGGRVPAHYESEAHLRQLPPTLAPAQFFGRAREGYLAAQAIPKTLAQLPCYCYCDRSFGHKSLHSCFEDTHGAQCGLCIDEALLAYKLEKEQKLSPAEIREAVIKRFGSK